MCSYSWARSFQSLLLLVASKALPWMLYDMSAAGLLKKKKIKPAWIPWWELTCTMKDEQQWLCVLSRLLNQERAFLGDSPGSETSPPHPAGVAVHSSLDLGLFLLLALQTFWCAGRTSGEMASDAGAAKRCFRDRESKEPLGPCAQMSLFDLFSRQDWIYCNTFIWNAVLPWEYWG